MEDSIRPAQSPEALESRSDEALRVLIEKAQAILTQREEARKKQAWDQIQAIAKANGLNVSAAKKRGRPAKKTKG